MCAARGRFRYGCSGPAALDSGCGQVPLAGNASVQPRTCVQQAQTSQTRGNRLMILRRTGSAQGPRSPPRLRARPRSPSIPRNPVAGYLEAARAAGGAAATRAMEVTQALGEGGGAPFPAWVTQLSPRLASLAGGT